VIAFLTFLLALYAAAVSTALWAGLGLCQRCGAVCPALARPLLAPHPAPVKEIAVPIERTKEMDDAFHAAAWHPNWGGGDPAWQAGLDAVLVLIQRDYRIEPLCREELAPGLRCIQAAGDLHPDEHLALAPTGARVTWHDQPVCSVHYVQLRSGRCAECADEPAAHHTQEHPMTKQKLLAHAHLIAAKAIRTALADPDVLDHLDIADALDVKALVEQLEGNHWRTVRRLNDDAWPTTGSTR
jgi:hypothetical protein